MSEKKVEKVYFDPDPEALQNFLQLMREGRARPLKHVSLRRMRTVCNRDKRFFLMYGEKSPRPWETTVIKTAKLLRDVKRAQKTTYYVGYRGFSSYRKAKKAFFYAIHKAKSLAARQNLRNRMEEHAYTRFYPPDRAYQERLLWERERLSREWERFNP